MCGSIVVEINVCGHINKDIYHPIGVGNYPYDCIAADKYPDAMVYSNGSSWLILEELEGDGYVLEEDGVYRLPYALK